MMTRIVCGLLTLWIFLPAIVAAQTPQRFAPPARSTDAPRQPADTALSASLGAHGGSRLLSIQSAILRGTSIAGANSQPFKVSARMDGSARVEWGEPVARTMVTTPQGRFEIRGSEIVNRPPHSGLHTALDVFSALGVRRIYASGANRGLVGTVALDGREVLRVHAGTDNQQIQYWRVLRDEVDLDFDSQTGHLAALHRWESSDASLDSRFVTSYLFKDYRDVQGILMPFRIERYNGGRLRETITVDSYELNPVLEPGLFER